MSNPDQARDKRIAPADWTLRLFISVLPLDIFFPINPSFSRPRSWGGVRAKPAEPLGPWARTKRKGLGKRWAGGSALLRAVVCRSRINSARLPRPPSLPCPTLAAAAVFIFPTFSCGVGRGGMVGGSLRRASDGGQEGGGQTAGRLGAPGACGQRFVLPALHRTPGFLPPRPPLGIF